jgi:rhodanese-related sulfurtransferase
VPLQSGRRRLKISFTHVPAQKIFRQIVVLLAMAALPATLSGVFHPRRPAWTAETLAPGEILLSTAQSWGNNVLWLDARPAAEFRQDHIPGALLLNEDDWDELLPRVLDVWSRDKFIVVYCSSLKCHASQEVAKRLREEARLPRVYVVKGGWEAWLAAKK